MLKTFISEIDESRKEETLDVLFTYMFSEARGYNNIRKEDPLFYEVLHTEEEALSALAKNHIGMYYNRIILLCVLSYASRTQIPLLDITHYFANNPSISTSGYCKFMEWWESRSLEFQKSTEHIVYELKSTIFPSIEKPLQQLPRNIEENEKQFFEETISLQPPLDLT